MGLVSKIVVFHKKIFVLFYFVDLNLNMPLFLPFHLNEEMGWIFLSLNESDVIHNDDGTWRKFHRGLNEHERHPTDRNTYALCEALLDGQFCFHYTRIRGIGGKDTVWKHTCCGKDSSHLHSTQFTTDNIKADFE